MYTCTSTRYGRSHTKPYCSIYLYIQYSCTYKYRTEYYCSTVLSTGSTTVHVRTSTSTSTGTPLRLPVLVQVYILYVLVLVRYKYSKQEYRYSEYSTCTVLSTSTAYCRTVGDNILYYIVPQVRNRTRTNVPYESIYDSSK